MRKKTYDLIEKAEYRNKQSNIYDYYFYIVLNNLRNIICSNYYF